MDGTWLVGARATRCFCLLFWRPPPTFSKQRGTRSLRDRFLPLLSRMSTPILSANTRKDATFIPCTSDREYCVCSAAGTEAALRATSCTAGRGGNAAVTEAQSEAPAVDAALPGSLDCEPALLRSLLRATERVVAAAETDAQAETPAAEATLDGSLDCEPALPGSLDCDGGAGAAGGACLFAPAMNNRRQLRTCSPGGGVCRRRSTYAGFRLRLRLHRGGAWRASQ